MENEFLDEQIANEVLAAFEFFRKNIGITPTSTGPTVKDETAIELTKIYFTARYMPEDFEEEEVAKGEEFQNA